MLASSFSSSSSSATSSSLKTCPYEHLNKDPKLQELINTLPSNYNFEIAKCIHFIQTHKAHCVALQMPEGLLLYACSIASIFKTWTGVDCVILGDVTYGACCVDDITAGKLGCDLLIHYGHSCLVPIDLMQQGIKTLYVFVSIAFDYSHLVQCIQSNFDGERDRLWLMGTIQFVPTLHAVGCLTCTV